MTRSATTPRATLDALLARQAAGRAGDAALLFAPEVDFYMPNAAHLPWVRHDEVVTPATMHHLFTSLGQLTEPQVFEVTDVVANDRDAVAFGMFTSVVKTTGRSVTTLFCLRISVHDGMITRYHFHEDSLAVAAAIRP